MGGTWARPIDLSWWHKGGYIQQFSGWSSSTCVIPRISFLSTKVAGNVSVADRIWFPCICVIEMTPPILWERNLDQLLNAALCCNLALRLGHIIGVLFSEELWSYIMYSRISQSVVFNEYLKLWGLAKPGKQLSLTPEEQRAVWLRLCVLEVVGASELTVINVTQPSRPFNLSWALLNQGRSSFHLGGLSYSLGVQICGKSMALIMNGGAQASVYVTFGEIF